MRCTVTVAEFTNWKSWTSLKSLVSDFWMGNKGVFQDDYQGWRIPYLRNLSRCFWIPTWPLQGMKYCFWLMGVVPRFNSTTTGSSFRPTLKLIHLGLSLAHTPGICMIPGISGGLLSGAQSHHSSECICKHVYCTFSKTYLFFPWNWMVIYI
jgi:hypothetical protein